MNRTALMVALVAVVISFAGCAGESAQAPVKYVIVPSFILNGVWRSADLVPTDTAGKSYTGSTGLWDFGVLHPTSDVTTKAGIVFQVTVRDKTGAVVTPADKEYLLIEGDYHVVASQNGHKIAECWVFVDPDYGRG